MIEGRQASRKPSYFPSFRFLILLLLAIGAAAWIGFQLVDKKTPYRSKPLEKPAIVAPERASDNAAPLAEASMTKAAVLMDENKFAYERTYLQKRYRVVGTVSKVVGPRKANRSLNEIFDVELSQWENLGKWKSKPRLALVNLPVETQVSLRPGHKIDATCLLVEWMKFENCIINGIALYDKDPQLDT